MTIEVDVLETALIRGDDVDWKKKAVRAIRAVDRAKSVGGNTGSLGGGGGVSDSEEETPTPPSTTDITPEMFGAVGNGSTNDSAAFAAAVASINTAGGTLRLRSGARYKINTGFSIQAPRVRIVGAPNCIIDASGMTSGIVITVLGHEGFPPYRSHDCTFDSFELIGPGAGSSVTGIYFGQAGAATDYAVHNLSPRDVNIHDFGTCVAYGDNAYNITWFNLTAHTSGSAIDCLAGGSNYGERLAFVGCTFSTTETGCVRMTHPDGNLHFTNCSFDYQNGTFLYQTAGRTEFTACHIEWRDDIDEPAIIFEGDTYTYAHFDGGSLMLAHTMSPSSRAFDCIVRNTSEGVITFDGMFMLDLDTSSGMFSVGDGITRTLNNYSPATTPSFPRGASVATSLLPSAILRDSTDVVDPWWIIADTATITSRISGTNIDVESTTVQHRTGTRSVRVVKAGSGTGQAALFIPVTPQQMLSWRLYYKVVSSGSGTGYLDAQWLNSVTQTVGPSYTSLGTAVTAIAIAKTGGVDLGWTEYNNGVDLRRIPPGTTHLMIRLNLDSIGASTFYFDDSIVSSW